MLYCKIWNDNKIDKVYECVVDEKEVNTVVKNCVNKQGWSTITTRCCTMDLNLYIEYLKNNAVDFH